MPPLTDPKIGKAKPKDKPYKLSDGGGLYIEITPSGGKLWKLAYRFQGKQLKLSIGKYPTMGLSEARSRREEAKRILANGENPSDVKKAQSAAEKVALINSFEAVVREWQGKCDILENTREKNIGMFERHAFPWIGARPIASLTAPELLAVLRRAEPVALVTAQRLRALFSGAFRYAIATSRAERDPSADLRGALKASKSKHHAAITDPQKVGELMRNIEAYSGGFVVRCALKLTALTFLRQGELRQAGWDEIDLDAAIWTVPAERMPLSSGERVSGMKMKQPHLVPLSRQAVSILSELYALTGKGRFIFPSERGASRPMSNMTINAALRTMGYSKAEITAHGFRATASVLLDRMEFDSTLIERQLAHDEPNKVKAAYKREQWRDKLEARKAMMQVWADYLDKLKNGAEIIPFKSVA